jgi:hypothetical protein
LCHLAAEAAQVLVYIGVAASEGVEPGEFRLELVDLLQGQVREAGVGSAVEDFADEDREGAVFEGAPEAVVGALKLSDAPFLFLFP